MGYKVPKGKVQLHVLISKEVYDMLLRLAPEIYGEGKYRGALSYIVEQALRAYLAPRAHTQKTHNPKMKTRIVFSQILECMKETKGDPVLDVVTEKLLRACIAEVRGSDPRTIEKWIRIFERQGLIKDLTPDKLPGHKVYEIVFYDDLIGSKG